MGLDENRRNDVIGVHEAHTDAPMTSGSLTEHRIQVAMSPNVLDWLRVEARVFGMTVPALIRHKLQTIFENRPEDWQKKLRG
jgi:hypothetical protein